MLFVDRPIIQEHIHLPWIVRRALNAISDRNKTKNSFALRVLRNSNLQLFNNILNTKIDPVTFYKRRAIIIFACLFGITFQY